MIAEEVSMNTPAIRIIMAINSMIMYGLLETLSTELEIASGIFQLASTQPNGPLQEMIIMMTAEVLALPFIILNNSLNPISRYTNADTRIA